MIKLGSTAWQRALSGLWPVLSFAGKRAGTAVASILVGYGLAQEHADAVLLAVSALGSVGFDILTSYIRNKSA